MLVHKKGVVEEPELGPMGIMEEGIYAVIKGAGEASELCEELRT